MQVVPLLFYLTFSNSEIMADLKRAEILAADKPAEALLLYLQYQPQLQQMPPKIQLLWHTSAVRSALNQSNLRHAHQILQDMLPSYQATGKPKTDFYYNLAGIWFRKSGYSQQALWAYQCALNVTTNNKDKLKYTSNAAVAARYVGDKKLANQYFAQAKELLKIEPDLMMQASVANNEGMLLLSEKRYEEASSLFTKALFLREGHHRINSQILSTLNLMASLLLNHDLAEFVRLDKSKLSRYQLSPAQDIYLTWLNSAYQVLSSAQPVQLSPTLTADYLTVENDSIVYLIEQIAELINVPLPAHPINQKDKQLQDHLLSGYFNECQFFEQS
ncbi:hypothetical protein PULV_a2409 [Pseudoalteromonas ulvae UL12]|nr:hypothetical protein [Pseudoalteromonas ulvae UL12]